MRYAKPTLRDSFFGWLGVSVPAPVPDRQERLERIRERMLEELRDGSAVGAVELSRRIFLARDVDALWYQRIGLMQALSPVRGEAYAAAVMAEITPLFEGLLPRSMVMAPSLAARRH